MKCRVAQPLNLVFLEFDPSLSSTAPSNKFKTKTKTKTKTNQPRDEVPEWYDPARSEIKCGKYRCKRVGHPPSDLPNRGGVRPINWRDRVRLLRLTLKKKTFMQRFGVIAIFWGLPCICVELIGIPRQAWGLILLIEIPATLIGVLTFILILQGMAQYIQRHNMNDAELPKSPGRLIG